MATSNPTPSENPLSPETLTDMEAERIFNDVMCCKPILEKPDMDNLEREFSGSGSLAIARRIGLAMAVQDGDWFKKLSEDRGMAVCMAGQLEAVDSCAATFRELADIFEAVSIRTTIALCAYPDLEELMAESKERAILESARPAKH